MVWVLLCLHRWWVCYLNRPAIRHAVGLVSSTCVFWCVISLTPWPPWVCRSIAHPLHTRACHLCIFSAGWWMRLIVLCLSAAGRESIGRFDWFFGCRIRFIWVIARHWWWVLGWVWIDIVLLASLWPVDDEEGAVVEFGELGFADIFGDGGEEVYEFFYDLHGVVIKYNLGCNKLYTSLHHCSLSDS